MSGPTTPEIPDDRLVHCGTAAGSAKATCDHTDAETTPGAKVLIFPSARFLREARKHDPSKEPTKIKVRKVAADDPAKALGEEETPVAARKFCPKCLAGNMETYDEFRARKGITRPRSDPPATGLTISVVVEFVVNVSTEFWKAAIIKAAPRPTMQSIREQRPRAHCFRWDYTGTDALKRAESTRDRIRSLDFSSRFLKFAIEGTPPVE